MNNKGKIIYAGDFTAEALGVNTSLGLLARLLILALYFQAMGWADAAEPAGVVDLVGTIRGSDKKPIRNASVSIYRSFLPISRPSLVSGSTADLRKNRDDRSAGPIQDQGTRG